MKLIDNLIKKTIKLKSPIVVGLDPVLEKIPLVYHEAHMLEKNEFLKISNIIFDFNKDIIDCIYQYVPAIKPQIAFYEMYGSYGIQAFEKTISYAKEKGLIVIEDGKRNDIGNTALAYANAHLGKVKNTNGELCSSFDVDFLTISPYLGKESLLPFIETCHQYDKGVFILTKTSNPGNDDIQNTSNIDGLMAYEVVAQFVNTISLNTYGTYGYSAIGAVVGATYPNEAKKLREMMPQNYFLVPGYGTQGGDSKDIISCFNKDGLGALVNSSRGIIFSYESSFDTTCSKSDFQKSIKDATLKMRSDIYDALKSAYPNMGY